MKKIFRITALALCTVILCVTLCSCQFLDDKKDNTAVYADENRSSFTFLGPVYKLLDISDKKELLLRSEHYGDYSTCYATYNDVPVLLSSAYGNIMYFGDNDSKEAPDAVLIYDSNPDSVTWRLFNYMLTPDDYDSRLGWVTERYYVREDKYEEIKSIIENSPIDRYYMNEYVYDDYDDPWDGGRTEATLFDEDVTKAIRASMKDNNTVKWVDLDGRIDWHMISLIPCDKDMVITDSAGSINLISDTRDYYLFYENDVKNLYKVNDKEAETIKKVFDARKGSLQYTNIDYYQDIEMGRVEYDYYNEYYER